MLLFTYQNYAVLDFKKKKFKKSEKHFFKKERNWPTKYKKSSHPHCTLAALDLRHLRDKGRKKLKEREKTRGRREHECVGHPSHRKQTRNPASKE